MQVAVNGVRPVLREGSGNGFQNAVVLVIVVRVQKADDVSGTHADTLVHGVVNAVVRFGNPFQPPVEALFNVLKHFQGAVRAAAVHDQVFIAGPGLRQHAFQGVLESGGAVAANGDDGDFHGGGCREKAGVPPFPAGKVLQAEFGEHVGIVGVCSPPQVQVFLLEFPGGRLAGFPVKPEQGAYVPLEADSL